MKLKDFMGIEATHLDYKLSLEEEKPKNWLKTVSAFANTQGGHILFGVTNIGHEPIGLEDAQYTASKIAEFISTRIEPPIRYTMVPFESNVKGRFCLDLSIANGPNYPYYYVHERTREVYVRHGDRSEIATPLEQNTLLLKGMNKTYDSLSSGYKLSDVSFTLLAATFKKETGEEFNLSKDLVSMGFVTEDGMVTNAGLLLCDQGYLKQSKIVCTRWKGTEKGAIGGDALDDQEFRGVSLIMLLANAEAFIRTNSKNPWTIRGMRREENSDYPFKAVREVLVNAMIHRDYQNIGSEVHVDMFDNRMEISSPGGMMNGSRIQELDLKKVPSMRRNEIISDIFGRLHYMDRRGSGIRRILNSYTGFMDKPEFYSDEYFFIVTLPNRSEANPLQMPLGFQELLQNPEKMQLSTESTQPANEKMQLSTESTQPANEKMRLSTESTQPANEKMQLSTESTQPANEKISQNDELLQEQRLEIWLRGKGAGIFRTITVEKMIQFLKTYEFQYSFNRKNIADSFKISESNASRIIKKSLACGLMRKEKNGIYYFSKEQDGL